MEEKKCQSRSRLFTSSHLSVKDPGMALDTTETITLSSLPQAKSAHMHSTCVPASWLGCVSGWGRASRAGEWAELCESSNSPYTRLRLAESDTLSVDMKQAPSNCFPAYLLKNDVCKEVYDISG